MSKLVDFDVKEYFSKLKEEVIDVVQEVNQEPKFIGFVFVGNKDDCDGNGMMDQKEDKVFSLFVEQKE